MILKDDLLKVAKAVEIAQDTLRIARQANIIDPHFFSDRLGNSLLVTRQHHQVFDSMVA